MYECNSSRNSKIYPGILVGSYMKQSLCVLFLLFCLVNLIQSSLLTNFDLSDLRIDNHFCQQPPFEGIKHLVNDHFVFNSQNALIESTYLSDLHYKLKQLDPYFKILSKEQMDVQTKELGNIATSVGVNFTRKILGFKALTLLQGKFLPLAAGIAGATFCAQRTLSWRTHTSLSLGVLVAAAASVAWRSYPDWCPIVINSVEPSYAGCVSIGDRLEAVNGEDVRWRSLRSLRRRLQSGVPGDEVHLTLSRTELPHLVAPHANPSTLTRRVQWMCGSLRDAWTKKAAPPAPLAAEVSRTIDKNGVVTLNVTLTKHATRAPSTVHYRVLPPRRCGLGVGYLCLRDFCDHTHADFNSALSALQQEVKQQQNTSLKALICDLRGNPGGSLIPALDLAAQFLPRGASLCQLRGRKRTDTPRSTNSQPDLTTALLLLVDGRTASASEVLVEALCGRAVSMGEPTKGKNYAQVYNRAVRCSIVSRDAHFLFCIV